ncbi:response regulator transcription factor [Gabonibacter massiliensis]|uniref:response regulator transcription factor n=1 Tax=Gabonibacter massiliensis TaxID=1720195 RepID=UPI00073E1A4F|nr:response regulator transcription factor [Gabonibacter massiliensis]
MIKDLSKEYRRLIFSQQPNGQSLNYDLLRRHIEIFSQSNELQSSAVTIYDNYRFEHAYVSEYHRRLFGNGEMKVHPDDLADVLKNAIAALKHVFQGNKNFAHMKTIREYRAKIGDKFRRVTESLQVLETDQIGNIWLTLCILEISPNQMPPFTVNSQIINTATGEVFSPLTKYYKNESILTKRELEILNLIAQGKLSKEISDQLHISVHTVNTYRQHILEKLHVDNSHEAVRYGLSLGLIEY